MSSPGPPRVCPFAALPLGRGGAPPARAAGTLAADSVQGRAYLFGGYCGRTGRLFNDLYLYQSETRRFHLLTPRDPPPPRQLHSFSLAPPYPTRRSPSPFFLFGGLGEGAVLLGDAWLYFPPPANAWSRIEKADGVAPPPRHSHVAVSTPEGVLVYGGVGQGCLSGRIYRCRVKENSGGEWLWENVGLGPSRELAAGAWLEGRGKGILLGGEDMEGLNRDVWMGGLGEKMRKVDVRPGLGEETNRLPGICGHSLLSVGKKYLVVWGGIVDENGGESNGFHDAWVIDFQEMVSWRVPGVRGRRRVVSARCIVGDTIVEFDGAEDLGDGKVARNAADSPAYRLYHIDETQLDKWIDEAQKGDTLEAASSENDDETRDREGRLKKGTCIVGHIVQSCEVGHWVEVYVDGERYVGMLMSKKVQGTLGPERSLNGFLESAALRPARQNTDKDAGPGSSGKDGGITGKKRRVEGSMTDEIQKKKVKQFERRRSIAGQRGTAGDLETLEREQSPELPSPERVAGRPEVIEIDD